MAQSDASVSTTRGIEGSIAAIAELVIPTLRCLMGEEDSVIFSVPDNPVTKDDSRDARKLLNKLYPMADSNL